MSYRQSGTGAIAPSRKYTLLITV